MINVLREHKKILDDHGWKDKDEYKKVSEFLKNYTDVKHQKADAYILIKKGLEKDYNINYIKFVKSHHSARNYLNETIKLEDVEK